MNSVQQYYVIRAKFSNQIYRVFYRDGLNRTQALEKLASHELAASAEFQRVLAFAKASERGLAPGAR